jgi:hypothetical protein
MSEYTKQDYEAAKANQLLTEEDPPRLTDAGEVVVEFGTEAAIAHPELSDDQIMSAIVDHFPRAVRGDRLVAAIEYYHASSLFSDEQLGLT